jgi:hypothetical protein
MSSIKTGFRDILPDDPTKILKGDGSWGEGGGGTPGTPGTDGHSPVVAFGVAADADRLTIDGAAAGPHLTGPPGAKGDKGDPGDPASIAAAWPIGSVFISVVSTNPATLLGFGTWAAFAAGRVLVGRDAGDADFDVVEETGGAKTQTPSAHAGAAVGNHAFTQPSAHSNHVVTQPTAHGTLSHTSAADSSTTGGTAKANASTVHTLTNNHVGAAVDAHSAHAGGAVDAHAVTQPSAHAAMSIVQPYIVVYMFKRTA